MIVRDIAKYWAGTAVNIAHPLARYDRCVFVIGHMRCGSTALSNILCSRPEISGYGEAHIPYARSNACGRLVVNQIKRKGHRVNAQFLFDKILHNALDDNVRPEFFSAHAIFLIREPEPSIASIVNLAEKTGMDTYDTLDKAAAYYKERVERLISLWRRFPTERRIAVQHRTLINETDTVLDAISRFLSLSPPLKNEYQAHRHSRSEGAGDPLRAGDHTSIVASASRAGAGTEAMADARTELQALRTLYDEFVDVTGAHPK